MLNNFFKTMSLHMKKAVPGILTAFAVIGGFSYNALAEDADNVTDIQSTEYTQERDIQDVILPNVHIGDINVGGMTKDEARETCMSYINEINAASVKFVCGDESVDVNLSDLGVSVDVDDVVNDAYSYGRKGNVLKRYKDTKDLESGNAKELDLSFTLGADSYANIENQLLTLDKEASPASIELIDGEFEIQPETVGIDVDVQATADLLKTNLNSVDDISDLTIDVVYNETQPEVTGDVLSGVTDKLGSFTTTYSGDSGRMANVENACHFINGTVVMPGEEFDTDATIRPYTEENGYHYAAEYSNGQVVQGLGGGVCQVSTTLYNAVLYAELEVTQRANHSLTVGYVKLAKDAAISGDVKNFKFKNNTDTPIYIAGACEGGEITFAIFGKETRPENRTLDFESVLVSTIPAGEAIVTVDESLPPGTRNVTQSAHTGYVAELWKHVYVDGELTDSIKINTSQYMSSPERVTVGPDAPEEEASSEEAASEGQDAVPAEAPAEPASTEPAPTEPAPAEDVPAEPAPTEPAPAEDVPAEPAPTEPAPAEDVPAEPAPTEAPAENVQ
ncbi:MAG: VanW family protein [Lachnospiraceae bacterium]|nr:VanW family protein [Lachnospiraceae bacterium]